MTEPETIQFAVNPDKLAAAVVYLTQRSLHDDAFGETKLVKLLYFADCAAYLRYGRPITGNPYIHLEHGPYPQDWPATKKMLERQGIVTTVKEKLPGDCQHRHRLLPTPAADTSALTEQDCFILDAQLRRFANFNAGDIEKYSHAEVAWRTTAPGAVIPYNRIGFRMPDPPTAETYARARRIADSIREYGRGPVRDVTPR